MDLHAPGNPSVAVLQEEVEDTETKALWVFAYGSLCWKPGFEFHKAVVGYVEGYTRRFWQGNTTHRGTEDKVCTPHKKQITRLIGSLTNKKVNTFATYGFPKINQNCVLTFAAYPFVRLGRRGISRCLCHKYLSALIFKCRRNYRNLSDIQTGVNANMTSKFLRK